MSNKAIRMIISISLNAVLVFAGVFLVYTAGSKAYSFGNKIFNEKSVDAPENGRDVEVTIKDNVSASEMADIIYNKGLTNDRTIFYFQIILSDYKDKFVGGTYILNTAMKPTEMLEVMAPEESQEEEE